MRLFILTGGGEEQGVILVVRSPLMSPSDCQWGQAARVQRASPDLLESLCSGLRKSPMESAGKKLCQHENQMKLYCSEAGLLAAPHISVRSKPGMNPESVASRK